MVVGLQQILNSSPSFQPAPDIVAETVGSLPYKRSAAGCTNRVGELMRRCKKLLSRGWRREGGGPWNSGAGGGDSKSVRGLEGVADEPVAGKRKCRREAPLPFIRYSCRG
eukprot:756632-Hanusia_phi.AAC.1